MNTVHWVAPSEKDTATVTLEKRLWDAADQFRANSGLKAQQYSGPILGLIFLRFAEAWPEEPIVQGVLAQLPWYHQLALLDKLNTANERRWYAAKAIEHNWSRNVLVMQIETRMLERSGQAVSNFTASLPKPQSDLARESLKDPYRFDFLGLTEAAREREIELKAGAFKPEHVGQLGFYLTAIDRDMKGEHDNPTIGLLLCKTRNKVVAEYALGDKTQPMGIAEYLLVESLPADLQTSLPSIEEIERALTNEAGGSGS